MKKLKCILIDDEPRNLELLNHYTEKYCSDPLIEATFSERAITEDFLRDESKSSAINILFWILSWMKALALISSIRSTMRTSTS